MCVHVCVLYAFSKFCNAWIITYRAPTHTTDAISYFSDKHFPALWLVYSSKHKAADFQITVCVCVWMTCRILEDYLIKSSYLSGRLFTISVQTEHWKWFSRTFQDLFMCIFHVFRGLFNRVDIEQVRFSYTCTKSVTLPAPQIRRSILHFVRVTNYGIVLYCIVYIV